VEKSFLVYTMSRSGHHAIVNWMIKQLPGVVTHHNDCIKTIDDKIRGKKLYIYTKEGQQIINIYTFEHFDLEILDTHVLDAIVPNPVPILIVRDLLNWACSLIHKDQEFSERLYHPYKDGLPGWEKSPIEVYKGHLMELAGWTNFTTRSKEHYYIGYNKWTQDKSYRMQLAQALGMNFTDEGFKEVTTFGDASSFDGANYDGAAHQMPVLYRYKHLEQRYIDKLKSDKVLMKLVDLTKDTIGPIPWL